MILTLNQLEEACPYTHYKRLELILPNLNNTLKRYEINTPLRICHFLTQIFVESNYFRIIQEPGIGFNYEGSIELSNTQPGDGRRYIGRGYLQIRGRKQYKEYKKYSDIDILMYPHYVTTPKVAMDVAGWIWNKKDLNFLADQNDLEGITKLLTGGYILIREREDAFKKIQKAIGLN
jgi:putative chitinase